MNDTFRYPFWFSEFRIILGRHLFSTTAKQEYEFPSFQIPFGMNFQLLVHSQYSQLFLFEFAWKVQDQCIFEEPILFSSSTLLIMWYCCCTLAPLIIKSSRGYSLQSSKSFQFHFAGICCEVYLNFEGRVRYKIKCNRVIIIMLEGSAWRCWETPFVEWSYIWKEIWFVLRMLAGIT